MGAVVVIPLSESRVPGYPSTKYPKVRALDEVG